MAIILRKSTTSLHVVVVCCALKIDNRYLKRLRYRVLELVFFLRQQVLLAVQRLQLVSNGLNLFFTLQTVYMLEIVRRGPANAQSVCVPAGMLRSYLHRLLISRLKRISYLDHRLQLQRVNQI